MCDTVAFRHAATFRNVEILRILKGEPTTFGIFIRVDLFQTPEYIVLNFKPALECYIDVGSDISSKCFTVLTWPCVYCYAVFLVL